MALESIMVFFGNKTVKIFNFVLDYLLKYIHCILQTTKQAS